MLPAALSYNRAMRVVVSDFISLDGVVQAPGGEQEDTDGGFRHGGWSMPFFDPEAMGAADRRGHGRTEALLFGRRTWEGMAAAWPEQRRRPVRRPDERHHEVRRLADARRGGIAWTDTTLLPADGAIGAMRGCGRSRWGLLVGELAAGPPARRERPRRRVPPDGRADPARRRQAIFPPMVTGRARSSWFR